MQVTAISTPRYPAWRWRITDYAGATVEESQAGFPSIAAAVAAGTERLVSMSVIDRSDSTSAGYPPRFRRR
jgi:ammonia channel protein AmtB